MRACERAGLGDEGDRFAAALNLRDAAEKLAAVDGGIFFGERVAAGGEDDAIALWPFAHDAMDERAATEEKKNNFATARVGYGFGADGEEIAGVDRRNHAAAVGDEADFAETVEDFGGEVEACVVNRGVRGRCANVRRRVRRCGLMFLRRDFWIEFWHGCGSGGRRSSGGGARGQEFLRLKRH